MRGHRTNNPLNIRQSTDRWDGAAETQTDKDFVQFQSMAYGYRAAWQILNTYYKKLKERKKHFTVENIIHRWAPPTENFTEGYMRQYHGEVVPTGWLKPLDFIRLSKDDSKIAKVRLIVPHSAGTTNASQYVLPYYYEITFQMGR